MAGAIERERAEREFEEYISHYNIQDPKIWLKAVHTRRVAALSCRIAASLQLPAEDQDQAWLNGMLHDIGRFEQVRRYGTFLDAASVDHAQLGGDLLFREGLIRRFLPEGKKEQEQLMEKAIRLHNALELPENLSGRELLFCRILRDADKIDILRIMCETPYEDIYNVSWEEVRKAEISDAVYEDIMAGRTVNRRHSRTAIDYRIGHIALANGLYFPVSRAILREDKTLEKLMEIDSLVPATRERLSRIREKMMGAEGREQDLIALRREFHRYPEVCWTEFRTTARVIEELEKLGLPVRYGPDIYAKEKMAGVPEPAVLEACMRRAKEEGARADLVDAMAGGYTGCLAMIEGEQPGPLMAVRVDLDALPLPESQAEGHVPAALGFRSAHEGLMHACGHDAHAAIGIGIARLLLARRDELRGKVLLVFQPGEEGLRGAAPLAAAGHFDACDYFFGLHVGMENLQVGVVSASVKDLLATTKFDVVFHGKAAHSAKSPELGRNALAAAAEAVSGILSIPPHPAGISRVNVGTLHAGTARNIIPDRAVLQAETRGETSEINNDLETRARQICQEAAARYDCTVEIQVTAKAESAVCSPALVRRTARILKSVEGVTQVMTDVSFGASEDVVQIMRRVQGQGGQATEMLFGMALKAPHHSSSFDVEEGVIPLAVRCMAEILLGIGRGE